MLLSLSKKRSRCLGHGPREPLHIVFVCCESCHRDYVEFLRPTQACMRRAAFFRNFLWQSFTDSFGTPKPRHC